MPPAKVRNAYVAETCNSIWKGVVPTADRLPSDLSRGPTELRSLLGPALDLVVNQPRPARGQRRHNLGWYAQNASNFSILYPALIKVVQAADAIAGRPVGPSLTISRHGHIPDHALLLDAAGINALAKKHNMGGGYGGKQGRTDAWPRYPAKAIAEGECEAQKDVLFGVLLGDFQSRWAATANRTAPTWASTDGESMSVVRLVAPRADRTHADGTPAPHDPERLNLECPADRKAYLPPESIRTAIEQKGPSGAVSIDPGKVTVLAAFSPAPDDGHRPSRRTADGEAKAAKPEPRTFKLSRREFAVARGFGKAARKLDRLKHEVRVAPPTDRRTIAGLAVGGATIADVEAKLRERGELGGPLVEPGSREHATLKLLLDEGYADPRFRLARLHAYSNKQRAIANVLNRFEAVYGPPGTYVIMMGDWSRGSSKSTQLRGHPPGMTMGWVDAFRARGHIIGFVPEAYTSRDCSRPGCKGRCEYNCLRTGRLVHGRDESGALTVHRRALWELSCCTSCGMIYGRDFNGSRGIWQKNVRRACGQAVAEEEVAEDEVLAEPAEA